MPLSTLSRYLPRFGPALFFLAIASIIGCGGNSKTASVSGTVTYKGAPLNSGTIAFYVEGASASGAIDADGKYTVQGAPVGPAKISIRTPPPVPEKLVGKVPQAKEEGVAKPVQIPSEYAEPSTSGLTYTVTSGSQTHPIELK